MKKWFQKLLKSIEDANKQNFGKGKMDCCELNQDGSPKKQNRKLKNNQEKDGGK